MLVSLVSSESEPPRARSLAWAWGERLEVERKQSLLAQSNDTILLVYLYETMQLLLGFVASTQAPSAAACAASCRSLCLSADVTIYSKLHLQHNFKIKSKTSPAAHIHILQKPLLHTLIGV